ncbi:MAG: N-acetylneuraminate synthase [Desulfocapsaceae bacterium]|nr:N-acetylneuraminate synthase [Desulfocapsaceae bacterium]
MESVFIIAEAGVNHNGDMEIAKQLIDVAADAGADAVKFQTFTAEALLSKGAPKAQYQRQTTDTTETQFEMIKKLELDRRAHHLLMERCSKKNIMFLSSPFDLESITILNNLGIEIFKIPSGEITNLPYLRKIGKLKKPIILSSGMSTMPEVKTALHVLTDAGTSKNLITVLHCNTEYPTPMNDVNLRAIQTMAEMLDVQTGYSDHTLGIEISIAAVAMGARVIEKHFTLNKDLPGPDHQASLEPRQFKEMVNSIRNLEQAFGDGTKRPTLSEEKNKAIVRKSIVANKSIRQGEMFSEKNLTIKRPGTGISPMLWDKIVGTPAKEDFQPDEMIRL